jgi:phospholipid/cholesterol/gamma-HCH transport system substrate-binding protein
MRRAIREHLRDFIAIVALVVAGVLTAGYILSSQATALPSWLPILGEERFELKADLGTAQAVSPGQGQAVMIAGIQVGDITGVELNNGSATVTMQIENDKAPLINTDAHLLLRPKTGLNDMVLEVDPGTSGQPVEEGFTVPLASTLPNVNPDEVLAALDADTQAFLKLLLAGGGEALGGDRGVKFGLALRQFEPLARNAAQISGALVDRRESIARSIHNFGLLTGELAKKDTELTGFVDSSNAVLQSFANQEASIRASLQELPPTLRQTNLALKGANELALATVPAVRDSLPGARALKPALEALQPFLKQTVAPIREQIRPFTTQVFPAVKHLRQGTDELAKTLPPLKNAVNRLNEGVNALAANPSGDQESYLFFLSWLNHNLNSLFLLQDANGPLRRGIVLLTCGTARFAEGIGRSTPFIATLLEVTNQPRESEIC